VYDFRVLGGEKFVCCVTVDPVVLWFRSDWCGEVCECEAIHYSGIVAVNE